MRRYTDLTSVIALLRSRQLTLVSPDTWDDKNDSHYLGLYRARKRLSCLAAICFTQASETYHHWRVFSPGPSGVCVRFKRGALEQRLAKMRGVMMRDVEYRTLRDLRRAPPSIEDLPFLKRSPFADEAEFRIVYGSDTERAATRALDITISSIDRIILSPWAHPSLRDHVADTLRSVKGCRRITVTRSSLVSNESWKQLGDSAV